MMVVNRFWSRIYLRRHVLRVYSAVELGHNHLLRVNHIARLQLLKLSGSHRQFPSLIFVDLVMKVGA